MNRIFVLFGKSGSGGTIIKQNIQSLLSPFRINLTPINISNNIKHITPVGFARIHDLYTLDREIINDINHDDKYILIELHKYCVCCSQRRYRDSYEDVNITAHYTKLSPRQYSICNTCDLIYHPEIIKKILSEI